MSHVTLECVMSHLNESCHTYIVMSHLNESCHTYISIHTWYYGRCMLRGTHMGRVYRLVISYVDESCHTWMSHATYIWPFTISWPLLVEGCAYGKYIKESCHTWMSHVTLECVMSHIHAHLRFHGRCMSRDVLMGRVYKQVMSHVDESCHTWLRHATHI